MTRRFALVKNGVVEQVVIAGNDYKPAPGYSAIPTDTGNIGDKWDGAKFSTVITAQDKNILLNYARRKQQLLANKGVTISVGDQPIQVMASTDATGRADLAGLVQQATSDPNFQTVWVQTNGSFTLTASEILQVNIGVQAYISQLFQIYGSVLTAINSGAITTIPQIDHPENVTFGMTKLTAWPNTQ